MAKSMAKSAGAKSGKNQDKKKPVKSKRTKTNKSAGKTDAETKYQYFRERRATELILAGCECVDTFYSRTLETELYKFKDCPELMEALRQIDLKKGVISCNY